MILPPFTLHEPKTVEEAVALKAKWGRDADFVAGGTDLLCNYKYELNAKPHVISLGGIAELKTFDTTRIGAAAVLDDVLNDAGMTRDLPVIPATIKVISSHLLRQSGTVGGNLLVDTRCFWFNQSKFWRDSINGCLKSEGDACRVVWGAKECVAVYSGDLAPVLITLGASVTLAGPKGRRVVPLSAFYEHDGIKRHVLDEGEMLVEVRIPAEARTWKAAYRKLRTRESFDFPVLGVAVAAKVDGDVLLDAHVNLGAVHTTPLSRDEKISAFIGKRIDEDVAGEIGEAVAAGLVIHNNTAMTPNYRRKMVAVFTKRCFLDVVGKRAAAALA